MRSRQSRILPVSARPIASRLFITAFQPSSFGRFAVFAASFEAIDPGGCALSLCVAIRIPYDMKHLQIGLQA